MGSFVIYFFLDWVILFLVMSFIYLFIFLIICSHQQSELLPKSHVADLVQTGADLFLSSNELTGSLPTEIGNCINLFNLYLNDNHLQGSLPSQIGQLAKLRGASLFNNYFQGKIPDEIGDLKDLIALYLDMNQLTGQIPESIGRLESMVDLRLRRNSLSGTLPTELGQLTQIQVRWIESNRVDVIVWDLVSSSAIFAFWYFSLMQTLYIDTNPKITGRIPTQLSNLPKLNGEFLDD